MLYVDLPLIIAKLLSLLRQLFFILLILLAVTSIILVVPVFFEPFICYILEY